MGLFNFAGLKDTLVGAKKEISSLDAEISKTQKKLEEIVSLPLPYDDFVEWAMERYHVLGAEFPSELRRELLAQGGSMRTYYMARRDGHDSLDAFNAVFSEKCPVHFERPFNVQGSHLPLTERAFFYAFKDQIQAAVRRVLDEVVKPEWPAEVGMRRAERIPVIEKLQKQLDALINERDSIKTSISSIITTEGL